MGEEVSYQFSSVGSHMAQFEYEHCNRDWKLSWWFLDIMLQTAEIQ